MNTAIVLSMVIPAGPAGAAMIDRRPTEDERTRRQRELEEAFAIAPVEDASGIRSREP